MENQPKRILDIEKGVNFRELGGYQTEDGQLVKYHKAIRSAGLGDLTANDLNFLQQYGLKFDVDFRSQGEIDKKPDRIPDGTKYISLPVLKEDSTEASKIQETKIPGLSVIPIDGYAQMLDVYRNIITGERAIDAYRGFFDELLTNSNDNESLLFHCSAGKDRTGMGAVFFLHTLGVPMDTIVQDYLLTNTANQGYVRSVLRQAEQREPELVDSLRALMTVSEDYLLTAIDAMNDVAGSMDNYIKSELKVTDNEVADLRKIYLM